MKKRQIVCIVCPKGCHISIDMGNVIGAGCERGVNYALQEITQPMRVVTSTVRIESAILPRLPVKTDNDIPKECIFEAMNLLDNITVSAPVYVGDIIVPNICGLNTNWIATRDMKKSNEY